MRSKSKRRDRRRRMARNASSLGPRYEILIKFHNLETTFVSSHRIVPARDLSFCRWKRRNAGPVVVVLRLSSYPPPLTRNMLMLHSPLPVESRDECTRVVRLINP